jgi:hypothetical protein
MADTPIGVAGAAIVSELDIIAPRKGTRARKAKANPRRPLAAA